MKMQVNSMEKTPLVSISMPVYKGANFMREAIDSALSQTYPNIEVIVVNDGSPDDGETERIALSYGDKIRYVRKENGGSSSALNEGIRNMRGEYFSWLSHDDVYTPDRTMRMMEEAEKHPSDKTAIVCSYGLIDENSQEIFYPKKLKTGIFSAEEMLGLLLKGQGINGCGILFSKEILDKAGFFREDFRYVNDTDFWCRLINLGINFVWIPDKLIKTRIHGGQVSVTSRDLFHKENEVMLLHAMESTLKQKNHSLAKLYAKKSAYYGYEKNLKVFRQNGGTTISMELGFLRERMFGFFIQSAKRIYKLLFWKR